MKKIGIIAVCCFVIMLMHVMIKTFMVPQELKNVMNVYDVVRLFPRNAGMVESQTKSYIRAAKKQIKAIIDIDDSERTFENTAKALDNVLTLSDLAIFAHATQILDLLSPDTKLREAAREASVKVEAAFIEMLSDKKLYHGFVAYAQGNAQQEQLTDEQRYFIDKMVQDFKRDGLDLPDDQLNQVKELKKELSALSTDFEKNIASDNRTIVMTRDELAGLSDDFINALKQDDDGNYVVGVDYPTYFAIMQQATLSQTRKKLYEAFNNRAYPQNETLLQQIIAKRDQLAKLLGFESYAHLDISDQMVQTPERVQAFLDNLLTRSEQKEAAEFKELVKHLPQGVSLTPEGKMQPWDYGYAFNSFKKERYNLDEEKIAEYFPVEETLKGLLGIYESFLSLRFQEEFVKGLWSNDIRLLKVFDKNSDAHLGYLLLDLYPRANKYSHAAHSTIIPATFSKNGKPNIEVSVIMANFPKARGDNPPLFKREDVKTFFHEFGHTMHALLGRTHIAYFAGTAVKRDFVEMPSQMLEEWMTDRDILKLISSHYQTGQSLPDEVIDNILAAKHIATGSFTQRQCFLSLLALTYFLEGQDKNVNEIYQQLQQKFVKYVAAAPDNHFYAAFGHLCGYGSKYYGYLWSKVFALDLFDQIKQHGLLDPNIGSKYITDVIGRGASDDPNNLLKNFLGRQPTDDAFFKDMGL
jgi:thimet oligopeptidase